MQPRAIQARLERLLPKVQRPARYTGGELNQVVKDWATVDVKVALVFPDIYDLGMSNLGLAVLYDIINQREDALAERAFAPWTDMETLMRREGIPLYTLETKHPVRAFDIVGFSLPYETLYTNTLNLLDLAGIPLFASDRTEQDPLVIAGGHATFNPEPMAPFIDAFVIGEGEEVIHDIINAYKAWKAAGTSREDLLHRLSQIWGVYVPAFYQDHYDDEGVFAGLTKRVEDAPMPIFKRLVPKLPPPPTKIIVPFIDTIGLHAYPTSGAGGGPALRRAQGDHLSSLLAHRDLLRATHGGPATNPPSRVHPGPRGRDGTHAQHHQ